MGAFFWEKSPSYRRINTVVIEAPQWGASNEYPQHMFSWRNKKISILFYWKMRLNKRMILVNDFLSCTDEKTLTRNSPNSYVVTLCWGFTAQSPQWGHVSLPSHTFTGQAQSSKQLTSIVHICSPEIANCPSWISRRERMTVKKISWAISMKECCQPGRGQTRNLLISSPTRIQLSYRSQLCCDCYELNP